MIVLDIGPSGNRPPGNGPGGWRRGRPLGPIGGVLYRPPRGDEPGIQGFCGHRGLPNTGILGTPNRYRTDGKSPGMRPWGSSWTNLGRVEAHLPGWPEIIPQGQEDAPSFRRELVRSGRLSPNMPGMLLPTLPIHWNVALGAPSHHMMRWPQLGGFANVRPVLPIYDGQETNPGGEPGRLSPLTEPSICRGTSGSGAGTRQSQGRVIRGGSFGGQQPSSLNIGRKLPPLDRSPRNGVPDWHSIPIQRPFQRQ